MTKARTRAAMADTEILVRRAGLELCRILRPLRERNGKQAVRYRKRYWPVRDGGIDLDAGSLDEEEPATPAAAPSSPETSGDTRCSLPPGAIDDQEQLLQEPVEARLLVGAGPGTGKTHAACMRVAAMIRDGIPATRIWMVSFTRTAVVELRNRIASALEQPEDGAAVRIATLDSHAWALHSGFSADATLTGSHDENIAQTLTRVREDGEVADYLLRIQHLVVDEAQDIIGERAELVLAMIDAVSPECGVTVFADEAQAIYGFTEDGMPEAAPRTPLTDALRQRGFREMRLQHVRRTQSPNLLEIFTMVRRRVTGAHGGGEARFRDVRAEIMRLADDASVTQDGFDLATLPPDSLVLMRRRVDVLNASAWATVPHRLRMSGLPACIGAWVGLLFRDQRGRLLGRTRFDQLWEERIPPGLYSPERKQAWELLLEAAGESAATIDLHRLCEVLGRSTPPMTFCHPEFGTEGPILGTIHASKGREAPAVTLFLPRDPGGGNADEEARVLFVGATRARERLHVGTAPEVGTGSVNGRTWRRLRSGKVQVEIGRENDLDAEGLAGRRWFRTTADAEAAQQALIDTPVRAGMVARADREADWNHSLESAGIRLAVLSGRFAADMRQIAGQTDTWPPPGFFPHLRSFGLRTVAFRPDSDVAERLHEPWRSSGFLLAPMLSGFSTSRTGRRQA